MANFPWRTAIVGLALLAPLTAHADPKDDARRHFAAGLQAVQDGDYEIALQRFLAAQEAYPHPATLYNIAQTYMDMDDLSNALTYFRLYRDAAPEKAEVIDPVIAAIQARSGAGTSAPTGPTPPTGGPGEAGAGTVIASGPTEAELDRLAALADELQVQVTPPDEVELARIEGLRTEFEALVEIFKKRREADLAGGGGTAVVTGPVDGQEAPPDGPAVGALPEVPEGDRFLEGAYDKLVVSASRVAQDPLDSPSTLTVLTSEDVRMMGAQNIDDVLRRVVGVNVMSLSSGHSDIGIRGFQRKVNNKVLILIDGRSTYSDFAAITFIKGFPIALEEVDRIEVIRGPGSAIYGANAVTGVVNIITKTPGEVEERMIKLEGGLPGLARGTLYANGASKDKMTSYRISAGYQQHGRWSREIDPDADVASLAAEPLLEDQDMGAKLTRGNLRIDQRFGAKGYASLTGGITQGAVELYNIGALPNFGADLINAYLRGDIAWGGLHLRAFYNTDYGYAAPWLEQKGQARTLGGDLDSDIVDLELEGPVQFSTGSVDHTLNLGVGYRYKRIEFGEYFNEIPVEHHVNGFVNEQLAVGKLGLVASLRIDRHPLLPLNETISPRAAVLYRVFEKTSVRATFGTAFRAPNMLESYMDFNLNNPAADGVYIRDLGDRNLSPERIQTLEVGIHDESTYFHTADLVVYRNQVTQLIDLAPINKEVNAFDDAGNGVEFGHTGWINLDDKYVGMGMEAELELYPADGLDVHGNVALQSVIKNPPQGQNTPDGSVSALQLNAGTMYRSPYRMDFTYDLHFVGPQTWSIRGFDSTGAIAFDDRDLKARTLMSARIAARPFADERLELAATAWNFMALLNDEARFREHPEGQLLGGRLFGTLTWTF